MPYRRKHLVSSKKDLSLCTSVSLWEYRFESTMILKVVLLDRPETCQVGRLFFSVEAVSSRLDALR
jgi:hypothetical protein